MPALTDVVIVSDFARIAGGAEKVAIDSAKALAARGYRVHYVGGIGPIEPSLEVTPNLSVHCMELQGFSDSGGKLKALMNTMSNPEAGKALAAILAKLPRETTVVHFHSFFKVLSSASILAAKQAGFRVVATLHDYGLACPQQSFFDQVENRICTRTPLSAACCSANCNLRGRVFKTGLVMRGMINRSRRLPSRFDAFAAVSTFSREVIRPFLPPDVEVRWIRNPIETERLPRRELAKDAPFLFVGRLTQEKDPVIVAKAAKALNVPVCFVGDGPEADAVTAACPGAERIPWSKPAEVHAVMRRSRALVFPSIWYEASPLVPYEAVSQGLPVISSDLTATRDTVAELRCGTLFRGGELEDLERAMRELMSDEVCEAFSAMGYETYWSNPMTLDAHADALLEFYADVLARPVR